MHHVHTPVSRGRSILQNILSLSFKFCALDMQLDRPAPIESMLVSHLSCEQSGLEL